MTFQHSIRNIFILKVYLMLLAKINFSTQIVLLPNYINSMNGRSLLTSFDSHNGLGNFEYLGCFNDKRESRDLNEADYSSITKHNKSMSTVEFCILLCSKSKFKYAGVQAM